MTIDHLQVDRLRFRSARSLEEVLAGLELGIGRPDMQSLGPALSRAGSFSEFEALVLNAVGSADLMEFLRIDLGVALRKDPSIVPYRMLRIIAGNPLIMKEMTRHVPDAGSYAPVTILVYEDSEGICICYDSMVSLLALYGNSDATWVARALDKKVVALLAGL